MMADNNDTNDFDEIETLDESDFDDFDTAQKGSLGDMWANNPLLKIGVVVGGIALIFLAIMLLGGDEQSEDSVVAQGSDVKEIPTTDAPKIYLDAIDKLNEENYNAAMQGKQSSVPIPIVGEGMDLLDVTDEDAPDLGDDDPLLEWRRQAQEVIEEPEPQDEPEPVLVEEPPFQPMPQQQQYYQPNPEATAALSEAMRGYMSQILSTKEPQSMRTTSVTAVPRLYQPESLGGGLDFGEGDGGPFEIDSADDIVTIDDADILVAPGTVLYGQIINEANSDIPGPVLARILSGPIRGAKMIGDFQVSNDYLTINFNQVVLGKKSYSINAIAVDPETSLTGIATDIDRRYMTRFILPAAASFLEGIGEAIEEEGNTTVTVTGETVTSSTEDLNARQELFAGVNEAAGEIADELRDEADDTEILVRVESGTLVGLLFLTEVINPSSEHAVTSRQAEESARRDELFLLEEFEGSE